MRGSLRLLGARYSLLCPAAQTSLIAAEQLSSFRDLGDPSLVIVAVAKAFESQLVLEKYVALRTSACATIRLRSYYCAIAQFSESRS